MDDLAKNQTERYEKSWNKLDNASLGYIDKVTKDIESAQKSSRRYWFQRRQINIAIWIYLALSPMLIIFDILSRHFKWF